MAQYIPKSVLVAELEKRQKEEVSYDEDGSFASWADQNHYSTLESIKDFINTIEVKEVDFEKKKIEWIEQLCKYFKANYLYVSGHESFISDFRMYAKNLK